uniref:Uncharacterized protein n=1 Tax=Meloidogyne enterolobii TaxID=390850 RepID=A0A6V7VLT3_MELEN|nr:unnamed protein product [Meloidogyne enterolobii]
MDSIFVKEGNKMSAFWFYLSKQERVGRKSVEHKTNLNLCMDS